MKYFYFGLALSILAWPVVSLAADAWPAGSGTAVATLNEPSGITWHEGRQSLFVVQDNGIIFEIDESGSTIDSWPLAGSPDLEGITLAESDKYLYLGVENPDSILEFDIDAEELTGNSWDLTTWMTGPDNLGLEGLSYHGGNFYAGLQSDGKIYVFDVNLDINGDVHFLDSFAPEAGYSSDLSGLEYNSDTGRDYVIYDGYDTLVELDAQRNKVENYTLPGSAQEGITLKTNCLSRTADVFVANDDNGQILKYSGYPITCLDADADGVDYNLDCNDFDASIFASQTYYRDIDRDGLGDAQTQTQTCSLAAPEGYATNSSDPADISASGRWFYINGNNYDLFGENVATVQYTDLNFFSDSFQEIIATGLTSRKRTFVTIAKVQGNSVIISKRRMLKKKYRTANITAQISKNKFTTRFNGKKKYVWKISSSGSFKKSR